MAYGLNVYILRWFTIIALILCINTDAKQKGEKCLTISDQEGKCVPPENCQITSNKAAVNFSACGYNLICCDNPGPVDGNYLKTNALRDYRLCGLVKEQARIFGGEVAEIGEFPWMAFIKYADPDGKTTESLSCSGTLINEEFVLTAAHCVRHPRFKASSVVLGEVNLITDPDCDELVANTLCADPVKTVKVKEVIPHPYHSARSGSNNIALIRLQRKVVFTEYIRPICLWPPDLPELTVDTRLTVAGWGQTENNITSEVLLKVDVPLLSQNQCNQALDGRLPYKEGYLCVEGEPKKGTCKGDGGVPLMIIHEDKENQVINWYQVGVVSHGTECGVLNRPAIYTKVSQYFNWIAIVLSEHGT